MNKKTIAYGTVLVITAVLFVSVGYFSKKPVPVQTEKKLSVQDVTVQTASASEKLTKIIQYPATVVGDQEVRIIAQASGTAAEVNFSLGDKIDEGFLLVKIDNAGNQSKVGEDGFKSSAIQQSQLSVDQAEKQLEQTKKNYQDLKKVYDKQKKNPTLAVTVSKAQVDVARKQIDIDELQIKNAKIGLRGSLDDHLIVSPFSGYITQKAIAVGDSVSVGQLLATISKTANIKIQFFVDQNQLNSITKGLEISLVDFNGNKFPFLVKNIAPQADPTTGRFLVEAFPKEVSDSLPLLGTVVSVEFAVEQKPANTGALILPLSAVNIGQNENYIFLAENGLAKKVNIDVLTVEGETAEISAKIASDAKIIVKGSKLVQDGSPINIIQ